MSQSLIVLDTHILLWFLIEPSRLSEKESEFIEKSINSAQAIITDLTLWEIAMLYAKQRIKVNEPIDIFLNTICKTGIKVCEITPKIAADSVTLPYNFHGDPVDRIIVSTTRVYSASLFTYDEKIIKWAQNGHVSLCKLSK